MPLSAITREALKPVHDSPFGDLFTWRTRSRPEPWQVWQSMVTDAPASPIAPCQEACPAGHRRGPLRRPGGRRPLRRCLCGRRGGQPVPVRVWLDLHGTLRGGLPPRHAGRADRDPDHQALRRGAREAPGGPATCDQAGRARRHRRRWPGRHVGRLLPGPARVRGVGHGGHARARRHDGDRDPGVPPPAIRAPPGDRADRGARGRAPPRHGDGPRLHARRPRARGLQGGVPGDRRVEEPAPGRARRRPPRGDPGDALPQGGQPRGEATPLGSRRRRRRRQHRDGRGPFGLAVRRRLRDDRLPARSRRHAGPGRGDRGSRTRGDHDPRRARPDRGRRSRGRA